MIDLLKIINLPKFEDPRGNLSVIEEFKEIPFKIERTYWIYDVPGGQGRGGNAYKKSEKLVTEIMELYIPKGLIELILS